MSGINARAMTRDACLRWIIGFPLLLLLSLTGAGCEYPHDYDGDGVSNLDGDCNDDDKGVYEGATEIAGDDIDQDCDGFLLCYLDPDQDGYSPRDKETAATKSSSCTEAGYVSEPTEPSDCDDTRNYVHPAADELCDDIDNDCDDITDEYSDEETLYYDADGDDSGDSSIVRTACSEEGKYVDKGGDCNDDNALVKPGLQEVCDGLDNDCNGSTDDGLEFKDYYPDLDGDGFGDEKTAAENLCEQPPGYVLDNTDCDDTTAARYPGLQEVCDALDNNCDGDIDELFYRPYLLDADRDGFGIEPGEEGYKPGESACVAYDDGKLRFLKVRGDCDDANASVHPGAIDVDGESDGDADCGGTTDADPHVGLGFAYDANSIREALVAPDFVDGRTRTIWVGPNCTDGLWNEAHTDCLPGAPPLPYVEDDTITLSLRNVNLKSTHLAEKTVLDGGSSRTVLRLESDADYPSNMSDVVVDGFTIQNGSAEAGGGVRITGVVSPTLQNCIIEYNQATGKGSSVGYTGGGGLYIEDASPNIRACRIRRNFARDSGGGAMLLNSQAVFERCSFQQNNAVWFGGGVQLQNDTALDDNDLTPMQPIFLFTEWVGNVSTTGGAVSSRASAPCLGFTTLINNSGNEALYISADADYVYGEIPPVPYIYYSNIAYNSAANIQLESNNAKLFDETHIVHSNLYNIDGLNIYPTALDAIPFT